MKKYLLAIVIVGVLCGRGYAQLTQNQIIHVDNSRIKALAYYDLMTNMEINQVNGDEQQSDLETIKNGIESIQNAAQDLVNIDNSQNG